MPSGARALGRPGGRAYVSAMADVAREIAPDVFCLGPWGRTQTTVYFARSGPRGS